MTSRKTIKSAFESMMFTWGEPLEAKTAAEVFNITTQEAMDCFRELQVEYEQESRGIRIRQVNKSFQFVTDIDNSEYIRRLCTPVKTKRLSQSSLEVLAIIAYKQPVTKAEIEAVRGVKCDRVIDNLRAKGLVDEVGRSQGIGRPVLFGTTDGFLKNFGFESIKDLPDIEDVTSLLGGEPEELEMQESMSDEMMLNQTTMEIE